MNSIPRSIAATLLLLISTAFASPTVAQQKHQTPGKTQPKPTVASTPAPTFDTLVPADSYKVYGEVRGVGQLIQSSAINDILEPILKLAGPPREFRRIVKWLNGHADELMTSRLLVATWSRSTEVPETLIAIEFASAEEAAKFATPLREFLPTVLPPVVDEKSKESPAKNSAEKPATAAPTELPYHLQQAGSLILLTAKPYTLKKLKLPTNKFLSEDPNFRAARNRFNSEPLFVFIDVKGLEKEQQDRQKQYAEAEQAREAQVKKEQAERSEDSKKAEESAEPDLSAEEKAAIEAESNKLEAAPSGELKEPAPPDPVSTALTTLASSFFGVETKWPDAIGLALSLENDSFDLRALLVSQAGDKNSVIPFVPMLIPGPAVAPESANVLPADTEFFVMMSLDLPQIYLTMSRPRPNSAVYNGRGNVQTISEQVQESPFAAIEKQLKLNIKDDVLPLLGSEIALRLPITNMGLIGLPSAPVTRAANTENAPGLPPPSAAPILLIFVRDKEALRALMPRIVDGLGFKGASSLAQTERREDTELVSFAGAFAYAFVGNFLVLSGDPAATRLVVDSYLKHETLAGESQFKSYTRWQPQPSQGQLYISPALMESYKGWAEAPNRPASNETRAFMARLSAVAQPITYSLSNEGFGALHELHLPKNLVLMAVAGISSDANPPPEMQNERNAVSTMFRISYAEKVYKDQKGSYGTHEQLIAEDMVPKDVFESAGYRFELSVSGDKFEVSAVPLEYGKTGNLSYFMNETGVLRGGDRNGASATSSDPPIY